MRRSLISALALVVAMVVCFAVVGSVQAQQKIPADFTYDAGKDSPGKVTFSHEKHKAAGIEKCTACHTKPFKMKKGTSGNLTMAQMKGGESCAACHNGKETAGKVVFAVEDKAKCEGCHKKS